MAAPPEGMPPGGHYELGFQLTPLTESGMLDTSGDWKGGKHPVEEDTLYKMALENRECANKKVQAGMYEEAIAGYSELIMQTRAIENETDIDFGEDVKNKGKDLVRQLRAAAYLNLSLCFLKTQQWTHANNTATRALQGDKQVPDPKDDVLPNEKKAKALFRRAQAQSEGFSDFEKARADLQKALEFAPDDKAVQQELKRVEQKLAKASKAADKKMAGFLNSSKQVKSGEGIFDEDMRPSNVTPKPDLPDVVKVSDGLFMCPKADQEAKEKEEAQRRAQEAGEEPPIDFEELSREINEMREERPEVYEAMKQKVAEALEEEAKEIEKEKQDEEQASTAGEAAGA
eukprot:gnl/TRDRNA2_/TRDRNA2_188952_c0_seq1.p1 gnl/TRDRNA2_/TRDRNA2_188952_c0~~gnl/TRDRNA2_/TRDRNA2_188952_c0_seq1.p1  ORF type:complete len:344 (+),score=130.14 gnl/TRDRNA2_/TRDRNA2_188952_c0_seq1:71-1102(+)